MSIWRRSSSSEESVSYTHLDVYKRQPDDSVWMVNALSRYLRMSINKGEAIVPLSDELDLTRTYLGIMQKRFSHQFEVEYDLDQAAMECLIPKPVSYTHLDVYKRQVPPRLR